MVVTPKVVGFICCGFLLCCGLSTAAQAGNAASAADELLIKGSESDQMKGDRVTGGDSERGRTIKGEVLRVEGDNFFVKGQDGKEVRLHSDNTTQKSGNITQGDRIEVNVNDQNHALSIQSAQEMDADRGQEADRASDSTAEPSNRDPMNR